MSQRIFELEQRNAELSDQVLRLQTENADYKSSLAALIEREQRRG